jgi:hypothetical protein
LAGQLTNQMINKKLAKPIQLCRWVDVSKDFLEKA